LRQQARRLVNAEDELVLFRLFQEQERIPADIGRHIVSVPPLAVVADEEVVVIFETEDGNRGERLAGGEDDRIAVHRVRELGRAQDDRVGYAGEAEIGYRLQRAPLVGDSVQRARSMVEDREVSVTPLGSCRLLLRGYPQAITPRTAVRGRQPTWGNGLRVPSLGRIGNFAFFATNSTSLVTLCCYLLRWRHTMVKKSYKAI